MRPCKVAIACQEGLIRALLRDILLKSAGVEIAAEACDCPQLLGSLKQSGLVDIVLLSDGLLKKDGVNTIRQIRAIFPEVKILAIHDSTPRPSRTLPYRVDGHLTMQNTIVDLPGAIEAIQRGKIDMPNSIPHE